MIKGAGRAAAGEHDDPILEMRHVAEAWPSLVIRPEVFAIGIEEDRAHRHLPPAALFHRGGRLIERAEEELVQVGLSKAGAGKDEGSAGQWSRRS